jgi:hypothetical protein
MQKLAVGKFPKMRLINGWRRREAFWPGLRLDDAIY